MRDSLESNRSISVALILPLADRSTRYMGNGPGMEELLCERNFSGCVRRPRGVSTLNRKDIDFGLPVDRLVAHLASFRKGDCIDARPTSSGASVRQFRLGERGHDCHFLSDCVRLLGRGRDAAPVAVAVSWAWDPKSLSRLSCRPV